MSQLTAALAGQAHDAEAPAVLIVDDEPLIRQALKRVLRAVGCAIETAEDGEEGLARARALRPALVILDVMMPRLDGISVCRALKRDPSLAGMRVFVLTASGAPTMRQQALEAGADAYLNKPFSSADIVKRVQAALEFE